ncbi:MAG: roadblock/LC7 domain-containing protein [Candidatus Hodarchaeales archaeon]|jgi:predicted regulator of Ras-like GTPase activity (Roadblock/LC7/MglB family)
MDISLSIHNILVKILKNTPGLQHAMLTDYTGLTLANVTRSSSTLELEGIGALSMALFIGMRQQGNEVQLGPLGFVFSEFSEGKLILQSISEECILVGVISPNANIQSIKRSIKKYSVEISDQINLLKTARSVEQNISKGLLDAALTELE